MKDKLRQAIAANKSNDAIKDLKDQVRKIDVYKDMLVAKESDRPPNSKGENNLTELLKSKSSEHILEEIISWRDDMFILRKKHYELVQENEKLVSESETHISDLQITNSKLIRELSELRSENTNADVRVEEANERLQKIEEKLLEERLTHEVEINALKALLEKQNVKFAKMLTEQCGITKSPTPDKDAIRLSPEGIVDENESSPKTCPTTNIENETKADCDADNDKQHTQPDAEVDSFREWIKAFDGPKMETSETSQPNTDGSSTESQTKTNEHSENENKTPDDTADTFNDRTRFRDVESTSLSENTNTDAAVMETEGKMLERDSPTENGDMVNVDNIDFEKCNEPSEEIVVLEEGVVKEIV